LDVVSSDADGLTRTRTITIDKTSLTISFGDYVLHFNDDPAGATTLLDDSSQGPTITRVVSTVHSPQGLGAGIIPLSLGGDWVLSDPERPGTGCTAFFAGDRFASQCNGVKIQPDYGDFYASHPYPYWAWDGWSDWWNPPPAVVAWNTEWTRFWNRQQIPSPNGDMTGVRIRSLKSSFGELGGEWEFAGSGGALCHATLSGTTFASECSGIVGWENQGDANGSITVRFGNGVASGSSSKGIELVARREHS